MYSGLVADLEILHSVWRLSEACGRIICLPRHIFTLVRQLMREAIKANLCLLAYEKELPEKWAKKEDVKREEPLKER